MPSSVTINFTGANQNHRYQLSQFGSGYVTLLLLKEANSLILATFDEIQAASPKCSGNQVVAVKLQI